MRRVGSEVLPGEEHQINGYQTAQTVVIKEQVHVKILPAGFEVKLAAQEGEALSQFEQKVSNLGEQRRFQVALFGSGSKRENRKRRCL